jgi:hypothetical protein
LETEEMMVNERDYTPAVGGADSFTSKARQALDISFIASLI